MSDAVDSTVLDRLRDRTRGPVRTPEEDGYDAARRIWNARLQRRPAAVVQCTGVADVRAAVDAARAADRPLAVKGGGHDYGGRSSCEDGLVVDLSPMDGIRVDPAAQTARVQGGATWGAFDHEAQAFGLATPGPTVSTVGVGGATLGGGSGHLARAHGLSLDNLISADVVTADGTFVHASTTENEDLFWGLRGGGGNFGVVTAFEFRLHEVGPEVLAGQIVHPLEDAGPVLRAYRSFVAEAPDAVQAYAFFVHVPPLPAFPEAVHGDTALNLVVSYAGPIEEGRAALRPLRDMGDPLLDSVRPQPYTALQQAFDEGVPYGQRWYSRAHYLEGLPDDALDTVLDAVDPLPGPYTMVYFEPMGGAIGRVDPTATAFPHRAAPYGFHVLAGWLNPDADEKLMEWTRRLHKAMRPYATGGVYANLLGEDEDDRMPSAVGPNYDRLARLKDRYDPDNRFRHAHNVAPAAA
jgi:FAD/FMN-containing dehydrogenase